MTWLNVRLDKLGCTVKGQDRLSIHTRCLCRQHSIGYTVKEVDVEMKSSINILLYHNNNVVTFCNP